MNVIVWGDLPLSQFLPVMLALLVSGIILLRKRATLQDPRFAGLRAGELARRLGLELTRGEPGCNLVLDAHARGQTLDVKLEGQVDGIPLELVYHRQLELESQLGPRVRLHRFDCRMIATARLPFPRFEVKDRSDPSPPVSALELAVIHAPAVDDWCRVFTADPAMARRLGEALGAFDGFRDVGLHLLGDGQQIAALMHDHARPLHAQVLQKSELMAQGLAKLARAVGG